MVRAGPVVSPVIVIPGTETDTEIPESDSAGAVKPLGSVTAMPPLALPTEVGVNAVSTLPDPAGNAIGDGMLPMDVAPPDIIVVTAVSVTLWLAATGW